MSEAEEEELNLNLIGYGAWGCGIVGLIYTVVYGGMLLIIVIANRGDFSRSFDLIGEEAIFKLIFGMIAFLLPAFIIVKFFPRRMFSAKPRGAQALEAFVESGERFQASRSGQFWVGVVMLCVAGLNWAALRFEWIQRTGDDYGLILVCLIFAIPNFFIGWFRMRRRR